MWFLSHTGKGRVACGRNGCLSPRDENWKKAVADFESRKEKIERVAFEKTMEKLKALGTEGINSHEDGASKHQLQSNTESKNSVNPPLAILLRIFTSESSTPISASFSAN